MSSALIPKHFVFISSHKCFSVVVLRVSVGIFFHTITCIYLFIFMYIYTYIFFFILHRLNVESYAPVSHLTSSPSSAVVITLTKTRGYWVHCNSAERKQLKMPWKPSVAPTVNSTRLDEVNGRFRLLKVLLCRGLSGQSAKVDLNRQFGLYVETLYMEVSAGAEWRKGAPR